jgi:pilus assembly protein TadC
MTAVILAGMLAGLGVALVALWASPAEPELSSSLERLDPEKAAARRGVVDPVNSDLAARVGLWVQRHVPTRWVRVPAADLNVLGIPTATFLGKKATLLLIGLAFPTVFTVVVGAFGLSLPVGLPVLAGLALGAVLSMAPDLEAQRNAAAARVEFSRAVTAYIDLVALEKNAGGGTSQALEVAAQVGDSWVFARLREELAQARWAGRPAWDALGTLGDELGVTALHDLGDIMRLSGEEGTAVYDALRARAAASRNALLAADHTQANRASETLAFPIGAIALVFMAILIAPARPRVALGS